MPIKVSCSCGQSFTAKDELRGQTLLCPKCHQPLTIGADAEQASKNRGGIDELFEEAGLKEVKGPRCPQCGAAIIANAVMCVECGMNFQSGEKIAAAKIRKAGEQGHTEAADILLELAESDAALADHGDGSVGSDVGGLATWDDDERDHESSDHQPQNPGEILQVVAENLEHRDSVASRRSDQAALTTRCSASSRGRCGRRGLASGYPGGSTLAV